MRIYANYPLKLPTQILHTTITKIIPCRCILPDLRANSHRWNQNTALHGELQLPELQTMFYSLV